MPTKVAKKILLDHKTAKCLITDAFNAWTLKAINDRWSACNLGILAERRREVMAYLEHLRQTAEGREIRR